MEAAVRTAFRSTDRVPARQTDNRRATRWTLTFVLVLVAYVAAGEIGLAVPFTSGNVSPLWPPAGVALGAMLVFGYRIWPAVACGALIVNYFSPIPPIAAAGITVGNTVGPLCGTWLLRRRPAFYPSLTRLQDVLALSLLGTLGAAVSATLGSIVLFLVGVDAWSGFASAWLMWWQLRLVMKFGWAPESRRRSTMGAAGHSAWPSGRISAPTDSCWVSLPWTALMRPGNMPWAARWRTSCRSRSGSFIACRTMCRIRTRRS